MKKIVLGMLIMLSVYMNAQDKIYLKDSKVIEAKVITVGEAKIEYKKSNNLEGPTFVIGVEKISLIVFSNGDSQVFNAAEVEKKGNKIVDFRRNRISADLITLAYNGRSIISYERLNTDGTKGIEYEFGLWKGEDVTVWVGYTFGATYRVYVNGSGKGVFFGPSIELGVMDWHHNNGYSYEGYLSSDFTGHLGGKFGYQFQLSSLFGLHLSGTAGVITNFEDVAFGGSANFGLSFAF